MMQVAGRSMTYTAVKQQCRYKGRKVALLIKKWLKRSVLYSHNFALKRCVSLDQTNALFLAM